MYDTVEGHINAGRVFARRRTRADDLLLAATWCEAFEGDPADDPESLSALATAAAYLRREADKRKS